MGSGHRAPNMGQDITVRNICILYRSARDDSNDTFPTVPGRTIIIHLDAMLPVDETSKNDHGISDFTQKAKKAQELARHHIQQQQQTDVT